ncbi:MAG: putative glycoside hydrolase, partial [Defluviitaleaceae bacterium]|nr:putative glycoside hydrolase [Defluviitaleaceae bacterium]
MLKKKFFFFVVTVFALFTVLFFFGCNKNSIPDGFTVADAADPIGADDFDSKTDPLVKDTDNNNDTDAVTDDDDDDDEFIIGGEEEQKIFVPDAPVVRGIYVTANHAGIPDLFNRHLELCLKIGMNAMVIDIRTEDQITMKNWIPLADEWGISSNYLINAANVIQTLIDNDIYPIARLVTFKDRYTVNHRPDFYI